MLKRIFAGILVLVLCLSLISCGEQSGGGGGADSGQAPAQGTASSPKPSEEPESSESPNPSENPEPSESPEPSENPEPSQSPEPSENPEPSQSPQPSEEPPVEEVSCAKCALTGDVTEYSTPAAPVSLCDACYADLCAAAAYYMEALGELIDFLGALDFGLCDLDGDKVPELVLADGSMIYTYKPDEGKGRLLYESMVIMTVYVDLETGRVMTIYRDTMGWTEGEPYEYYELYGFVDGWYSYLEYQDNEEYEGYEKSKNALLLEMEEMEYLYRTESEETMLRDLISALAPDFRGDSDTAQGGTRPGA